MDTRIDTRRLYPTSRLLTQLTGQAVPRNKAIVGENAFAHESGIHQHGMLKHRGTYEIMRPQDVGIAETRLVLGKHSGRAALRQRLEALGHTPDDAAMEDILARFKTLADKKREIHDEDLEAIALGQDPDAHRPVADRAAQQHHPPGQRLGLGEAGPRGRPRSRAKRRSATARSTPCCARSSAPPATPLELTDFSVRAVSEGGDAQGQAQLTARHAERDWRGHGVSTDIVEATALAALAIVNRIERQTPAAAPAAVAHL